MSLNKRKQACKYIVCDILSAIISWSALFLFRKINIDAPGFADVNDLFADRNFWLGIVLVPAGWLCLYIVQGIYRNVYRKSRLKELLQTLAGSLIGTLVIFFTLLIDDDVATYGNYYLSLLFLLAVHFSLTYLCRLTITTRAAKQIHSRRIGFPTIMVGNGEHAYKTFLEVDNQEVYSGNLFVGYVATNDKPCEQLTRQMDCLGTLQDLAHLVDEHHIEEVIIAPDSDEKECLKQIIKILNRYSDVIIKLPSVNNDIVFGSVKLTSIFHSPLITLNLRFMEEWQYSIKRLCDILLAVLAMILLSPLYLATAILVKCSSPGPVFYAQERVGKNGKPFKMHKFRSMYIDAEKNGPMLSSDDDPRITPFGRFMRKVRLDEIPQFYNVLIGNMSLVGPRPERQYFIDKIVARAPEYLLLQRIKPGITSWGQVKYGYAENVDEMLERLRYDLLYLENMSITTDIKILIYTILIVFQGRGK